jgi:hypothetical protein
VRDHGLPDCVAIGSSVVDQGIDSEALSSGYQQQTGRPFYCLNGAITGLRAFGTSSFARIYTNRYLARTVIYGVSYRDFGITIEEFGLNTPWVDYQLGMISSQGWIEANFMSYRYFLTGLWPLVNANTAAVLRNARRYTDFGQRYVTRSLSIAGQPDRRLDSISFQQYAPIDPTTMDMAGLNELADLKKTGLQIIVVEMPLPRTSLAILKDGEQSYAIYHERLVALTANTGLPLISLKDPGLISDDGWSNYSHLNAKGAQEFSEWLGQQLGSLILSP